MALTPQNNEAFLREVDDELRRDQMATVWQRYGRWIVAVVVLVLAAFGGWTWWNHHQDNRQGAQGVTLNQAIDDLANGRMAQANAPLAELAGSKSEGYRAVAKFEQANLLLAKQDLKGAAAKFAEVAGDASMPQPLRDLAVVRQTAAEYDTLQPQAVVDRLRGLAVKDSPWFGTAGEMTAVAYLRLGRRDLAGKLFGQMAQTDTVPESIRSRAVQMAGALGVDAVDQPAPATATAEEKSAG